MPRKWLVYSKTSNVSFLGAAANCAVNCLQTLGFTVSRIRSDPS